MLTERQRKLFFIIGIENSGVDLLQQIMNTFFGFCNAKESKIFGEKVLSLWTPVRKNCDFSCLERFIEENWISEYFVEETPDSILCLSKLNDNFPEANYIFLEHDPNDIVLSQLNKFRAGLDAFERYFHIENLIMEEDDLILNREQYYSKFTLKQIYQQIANKKSFSNKITIRYESLGNSFYSQMASIERQFGIKSNLEDAYNKFRKSSQLKQIAKTEVKNLTDVQAIAMVTTARRLWNY